MLHILSYLEKSAKRYPSKAAFVDEKKSITFECTLQYAKAVGTALAAKIPAKSPIAVLMEKTADCIPAFLGAVYAGCFYVPIDTKMPNERIYQIFNNLKPAGVIYDAKNQDRLEAIGYEGFSLSYEEAAKVLPNDNLLTNIRQKWIDTDLLYVLFTSGSTGIPKGVTICHRSVTDYIEWVCSELAIDETVRFGNQAPFHFDNSILDIYCTLKTGASMYIIPQNCFMFPKLMMDYLNKNRINTIFWVPYALIYMANSGILDKVKPEYLQKIYFCGEVMPCKQLNIWRKALPKANYCNMYGPTEITDVCSYFMVDREFSDDDVLPIGRACANTRILLLDETNQIPECGQQGELCVVGTSLSFGYYNNPEKTKQVFVQNPLNQTYPEIIYRTGDLAKYNEHEELIYLGRKDFQIKHHGYRIELGEIENAVISIKEVENACCLYDSGKEAIICFYMGEIPINLVKERLKEKLPGYMMPEKCYILDQLPQTANGKIDRIALKKQYLS